MTTLDGSRSPREWVRDQLDDIGDLSGYNNRELVNLLAPEMRLGDIRAFAEPGLRSHINDELRARGYLRNHAQRGEDGRVPLSRPEQLAFDEIVAHLEALHRSAENDRASAYAKAEAWVATHPDAAVTADELMDRAGWQQAA